MTLAGNEALAGAVAGLGIGLLEYAVATRVIKRWLGGVEAAPGSDEMARWLLQVMNVGIAVVSFGVLPLVGFVVGRMMG